MTDFVIDVFVSLRKLESDDWTFGNDSVVWNDFSIILIFIVSLTL